MAINSFTNDENPDIVLTDVLDGQVLVWDNTANALVNATFTQGSGVGEANDAQNLGVTAAREGLFANKVASTLRFKSLVAGSGITLSSDGSEITIAASAGSGNLGSLTGTNLGAGSAVFSSFDGTSNLNFRTITAGNNVTITQSTNEILIAADDNASTLNGLADTGFLKTANNLSDVTASTARTNLAVYSKTESDAKYLGNNKHNIADADGAYDIGSSGTEWRDIYARRLYGTATHALTADSIAGFAQSDYLQKVGGTMTGALTLSGAPTQALHAATKGYVDASVNSALDGAPGALDTLNELAAAIGDDANFASTVTTSLAGKLALAGGTMSGNIDMAANKVVDLGAPTLATDAATKGYVDTQISGVASGADLTLSNLSNAGTARTNLGLGTASTQASGSFLQTANNLSDVVAATARTNLGLGSAALVADTVFLKTANNLSDLASASDARTNLGLGTAATTAASAYLASNATTDSVLEGSSNLYFTASRFNTEFAGKTTDDVNEGSSNLYYTDGRADARIAAASIADLSDVNLAGAVNGSILVWNASNSRFEIGADDNTGITQGSADARYFQLSATNLPDIDGTYDIGSSTLEYRNIYARKVYAQSSTVETLNGATGGTITGNLTTTGDLTVQGTINGAIDLSSSSIGVLSDVDITGITNNDILKYSIATGKFEKGTINSDEVTEGSTNLFHTTARANTAFDNRIGTKTTSDLAEGTNLYFTNARAISALSSATTDNIAEGTNLYYTTNRANTDFDTRLGAKTSDDLAEGSTNQYFTTARGNASFDNRLGTKTTADLTEGTNLYFTNARAISALTGATTDNIAEGTNNLYFTNARADARVQAGLESMSIDSLADVDVTTNAPTAGQRLSWNGSNWVPATDSADFSSYSTTAQANALYVPRDAHYIPDVDNAYDFGNSSREFRNIYANFFKGQSDTVETIHGANGGSITGAITASGNITAPNFDGEITKLGGNISISTKNAGDVLTWNGSVWTASAPTGGGGGGATSFATLTDTDVSNVTDNDVLIYNSTSTKYEPSSEIFVETLNVQGLTRHQIDATNTVTGTGQITASDTITINGTAITFASTTTDDITDLANLINAAGIANISAQNRSGKLRISESTGATITIAGTGTLLTVVGFTAQTYTKTAGIGLDVDVNVNVDGTLNVDGATVLNSTLTVDGATSITDALTVTGAVGLGTTTFNGGIVNDFITVGQGSSNTTAVGLRADKGTGSRYGYWTWSKANNRWESYYSDQSGGGAPFSIADINANFVGTLKGLTFPSADGTAGQVLTTDGNGVLSFTTVSGGGGGGITLADARNGLSVTQASASGAGSLSYANSTGVFTYTPPVLPSLSTINNITDVDTVTVGPTNGQALVWEAASSKWKPGSVAGAALSSLTDVDTTGATNGSVLKYNASASEWQVGTDSTGTTINAIADIGNVSNSAPTNGQVLKWNQSASEWAPAADSAGTSLSNTDDLSEGSTNLYFTDGRAVTAITSNDLDMGSNKILYSNVYAGMSDLPNASSYHGMFAHVHSTGKAYYAHGGAWVELARSSDLNSFDGTFTSITGKPTTLAGYGITDGFDGQYSSLTGTPTIPSNIGSLSDVNTSGLVSGQVLQFNGSSFVPATITNGSDGADGSDGAAATIAVGSVSTGAPGSNVQITNSGTSSAAIFAFTIPRGATGAPGNDGADGADGATGPQGAQGPQGTTGAQGPQGIQGNTGAAGVDVTSATINGSDELVLTLSDASQVNAGSVVGPQGATGAQGPQGIQGATGPAGADGADGVDVSSATISGDNLVITLSDSTNITAGNVRGPQGSQGATGSAGADGADGAAATLAVGTVTTGAAGTNATVTNAGTSSAAVFNFAIPQGAAGTNGTDGADGADGIQLNDISVGSEATASGDGSIAYNNATGVFTYTPPTLAGLTGNSGDIAEGSNQYFTEGRADARIAAAQLGNLSNVHDATPTDGQVLTWDNGNSYWKPSTASGGASALNDLSDATLTSPAIGQVLRYNGVNSFVNTKLDLLDLDGVSDGTNGQVLTTDGSGNFTFTTVSGGGSAITVQDEGSALSTDATTFNFVGAGVTATGTGATKTITIPGGGGGGAGGAEYFKINYATNGDVSSISDASTNVSVSILNATAGQLQITVSGSYSYPPTSIQLYGYVYNSNVYNINPVDGNMTTRTLAGNGSAGSPTVFGAGNKVMTLNCSRTETGAANGSGFPPSATHAWVMIQMGG